MYVYSYVHECLRVYVYIYMDVHTCMHMYICTYKYMYVCTLINMHLNMHKDYTGAANIRL